MTLRLLVADDNAAMQKMVRLAFAGENAVIEAVSSGDAALGILREFRPDVVLADVSMPGFNGYEVCERIRRDPEFAAIPVILLNGAFDPFNDEEAARVEASGQLTKPFDPSEMIAMMEKLLRESARRAAFDFSGNKNDDDSGAEAEIAPELLTPPSATGDSGARRGTFKEALIVSPRALESYLGRNRILEIFGDETLDSKAAADSRISDEFIEQLAERVAEKLFPDIEALIAKTCCRSN
ncbi:MAG: response regulator [Acidobacteriota bacterium]|jgi:CheY-like chemotaxis protein|nr:response regulator [Acidobacteriota bacterium]